MSLTKLWIDQYKPKSLAEVIFASDAVKRQFQDFVSKKSIPNLLLVGAQGTGKSSISRALVKDLGVDPMDIMRVNCSDEKIEAIREKVKAFAMTIPNGDFKVVRLEEFDGLSLDAQKLLRVLMEDVSSTCRFIATANYQNKIIPAMQSRFQIFTFNAPNRDAILLRGAEILETEGVKYDLETLEKVVAAAYPDIRQVIQLLEKSSASGTLKISADGAMADWKLGLIEALTKGNLAGARKLVCESASNDELVDVYRFLYDNIDKVPAFKGKADEAIVKIAQYQFQHNFVKDGELQIAALFIELSML